MKLRKFNFFFAIALFLIAFPSRLQAAVATPTAPKKPEANAPPPSNYVGPTENLTKVANALYLNVRSLSTQVFFRRGIALRRATVCIDVRYHSDSGYRDVQLRPYDADSGNRFIFNDPEGAGAARQARLEITLYEHANEPSGCPRLADKSFGLPEIRLDLQPLYNIEISPLSFTLESCDAGDNQLGLQWYSPDGKFQSYDFNASVGKTVTFQQFAWKRDEVNAANLHSPAVGFWKRGAGSARPNLSPSQASLAPGKTRSIRDHAVFKQCRALIEYTLKSQLYRLETVHVPPRGNIDTGGMKP